MPLGEGTSLYHADLNAAYRIALRALAHGDRAELLGQTWIEKKPYLVDAGVFPDSILRNGCPFKTISSSERLWEKVNGDLAMQRCREINLARFASWKIALPNNNFQSTTTRRGRRHSHVTMSDAPVQSQGGLESQPPLPVRRLHNFIYCPRLFYFQWVENIFQENGIPSRAVICIATWTCHQRMDDPKELGLPEGAKV